MYIEGQGYCDGVRAVREACARAPISLLEFKNTTHMPLRNLLSGDISSLLLSYITGVSEEEIYELAHD